MECQKINKSNKKYRKKLKKHHFLYLIFVTLSVILVIINISDIFSGLLTHSGSLFFKQKIEVSSYSVYAVSGDDFDNEIDAKFFSSEVKSLGGSGYIIKSGEYFVIVSSYPNLTEAHEIQSNLIQLGYNSRIVNIHIPEVSIFYQGKNATFFKNCISIFRDIYKDIYENSILLDQQKITNSKINGCISAYISKLSAIDDYFSNFKTNIDTKISKILRPHLSSLSQYLKEFLSSNYNGTNYTSELKTLSIKVATQNEMLSCELKEKMQGK